MGDQATMPGVSGAISSTIISFDFIGEAHTARAFSLSRAGLRILSLLMEGLTEKEVAARLYISPHTVHTHLKKIHHILHVKSRGELIAHVLKFTVALLGEENKPLEGKQNGSFMNCQTTMAEQAGPPGESSPIGATIIPIPRTGGLPAAKAFGLSRAQLRVLGLLMEGLTEKEVAARLHVSPHTVHTHLKKIYQIVGVHSRGELMSFVLNSSYGPAGTG